MIKATPDGGLVVTGNGSPTRPFYIELSPDNQLNPLDQLDVATSESLQLTIARPTLPGDLTVISGTATPALIELRDVLASDVPVNGDVVTWVTDHWEFRPSTGGGGGAGTVFVDNGIAGDGTSGNPVVARTSGVWGTDVLSHFGIGAANNGSLGQQVYIGPTGLLRTQPSVIALGHGKKIADLPSSYPLGLSLMSLGGADASAGSWPYSVSAEVLTLIRHDSPISTGWQIWTRNVSSATQANAEMQFRHGADSGGWTAWMTFASAAQAKPVDCSAETKFCTSASTAANPGATISARYTKVGKTVTFWGNGGMGTSAVSAAALLLPPSAGTPAWRQSFPPPGFLVTGVLPDTANSIMTSDLTRIVNRASNSTGFQDYPANTNQYFNFTYEVL